MSQMRLPARAEVPREQTWDSASVYPSRAAWEEALRAAGAGLPALGRFRGRLGESATTLLEALRTRDEWVTLGWRLRLYPNMRVKVDAGDAEAAADLQRAESLRGRIGAAVAYLEPELLALDGAHLDGLLAETPELAAYGHYVAELRRRRAHVAASEVEAALAAAADLCATPYATYKALTNGDLRFAAARDSAGIEHPVAPNTIYGLLRSPDRALRRSAWEADAAGFGSVRGTLAHLLAGAFQRDIFLARARGYPSALEAALDAALLPPEVYVTLLEACRRALPLWHRYWDLRRRALGLETLAPYDLDVPLTASGLAGGTARPFSYDEAREIILGAVAPFGEEYGAVLRRGLYMQRWVDWAENQGKQAGAEQSGVHGTHPFVLLSFDGSLISVSALAHELGHAMHAYYAWTAQPSVYEGYTDWLSETASTCSQALVRAYLLRAFPDDRALELAVLSEALAYYERYLFLMPLLSRLEWEGHARIERGRGMGAEWLSNRCLELLAEGYGPAVTLDAERSGQLWAVVPHLYLNFYTFQYALGIASANQLATALERDGAPAAERYLALLRAGASVYPLEALRAAGVDLTTPEPVEAAFASLAGLLDRLEALIG